MTSSAIKHIAKNIFERWQSPFPAQMS